MSQSVTGGFGERALERIVASDTFVPARVKGVVFSEMVDYVSGPVGRRIHHTGRLSVVSRWEDDDNRDVRIRGVAPELFIRLYVKEVGESILVKMDASDIVQLGEFASLQGTFNLLTDEVDVKVRSESVTIDGMGSFQRENELKRRNWESYSSWNGSRRGMGLYDYSYKCGQEVTERLREAWARENGIYSGLWTVRNVDDPEYSSRVELTVEPPVAVGHDLQFSVSMNDWDENEALRKLVENDCGGVISNLEQEKVFVSLGEYNRREPVTELGPWKLYRVADKPNILSRVAERWL